MARPIKLNDKLQQNIVDDLKRGASIADACANNHLGESTYYRWRAIGEAYANGDDHPDMPHYIKDREALQEFWEVTTRAKSKARITASQFLVDLIGDQSQDARDRLAAAKFLLERTDPENWGRQTKQKTELTGKDGDAMTINVVYEDALGNND